MTKQPDGTAIVVRPAVLHDLELLADIDAICFPPEIAYPREEIASLITARSVRTLVAERSGVVAGFASLRLLRRGLRLGAQRGELITIDVLPEFRRARVGWELHQALQLWLRSMEGVSMELHVAVNNVAAIRFYENLGYSIVARAPRYYPERLDAWRMEKFL